MLAQQSFDFSSDTYEYLRLLEQDVQQLRTDVDSIDTTPGGGGPVSFGSPVGLDVGGSNADGVSTDAARADHEHALPEFGTTAGTFAEGDHTHEAMADGYFVKWHPDAPPSSPHADDDECDSGSIDPSWTLWDPSGWGTYDASMGYYDLRFTSGSGARAIGYYKAIPDAEFSLTAKVSITTVTTTDYRVGVFVSDDLAANPTTADWRAACILMNSGTDGVRAAASAFSANNAAPTSSANMGSGVSTQYVRLLVNTALVRIDHSVDGLNWYRLNATPSAGFTPVHCGFFHHASGSTGTNEAHAQIHWMRFRSGAGTSGFPSGGGTGSPVPIPGGPVRYLRAP